MRTLLVLAAMLVGCATAPPARQPTRPAAFVAASDRSFAELMDESMSRMHHGMMEAPRTGEPDRDFVTQMIPHHQGAIDMAKALLLYGKDPALQRLAKEIIVDQQTEVQLMQAWLVDHPVQAAAPAGKAAP